jgi:ribosomal protein L24
MRWLSCLLFLSFSAHAASVLLVPADDKARALAEELTQPFADSKLTVKMAGPASPGVACLSDQAGRDACLTGIGEKAKVVAVFVVTGALKGAKGPLTLEMLAGGKVVKKVTVTVAKGKVAQQMKAPVAQLIKLLPKTEPSAPVEPTKVTVTPKEPEPTPRQTEPEPTPVKVKVADAPTRTEPVLTPTPRPDDGLALRTEPAPKSKPKVAAWVVTGLAVVAAGTAATFGGLGFAGKSQLANAPDGVSPLSYSQALALQQSSNTQLSIALGAAIGAGVSGAVAGVLWGVE